jgi:hypothetical protein
MATITSGPDPSTFYGDKRRKLILALNAEMVKLEAAVVKATPASDGRLRQGWDLNKASQNDPRVTLDQTVSYFLPVEFGRSPGKGISAEGQESVARWARLALGMPESETRSFAFLLSQKYKREGRPATGFAGLAKPGTIPTGQPGLAGEELTPVSGGLIDQAFKRLDEVIASI